MNPTQRQAPTELEWIDRDMSTHGHDSLDANAAKLAGPGTQMVLKYPDHHERAQKTLHEELKNR